MSRLLISLVLFILTIIFLIIAVVIGKAGITSDNNAEDCLAHNPNIYKQGDECYMWKNAPAVCLKGNWHQDKEECIHPAEPAVMAFFILASISFIACLVFFIMGIVEKKKKKKKN